MTTEYKIPCYKCDGKGKTGHKAYSRGCFTCAGDKVVTASKKEYDVYISSVGTYITVTKGRVSNVMTTHNVPSPKTPKAQYQECYSFLVGDNEVTYNKKYCSELDEELVYSAVFKHISRENTTEIIGRLIRCHYTNEIKFYNNRGDSEMVDEIQEELVDEFDTMLNKQYKKVVEGL